MGSEILQKIKRQNSIHRFDDTLNENLGDLDMYENLDDFGSVLVVDGKAVQSFATRISQKDSGNRGERDGDWCRKQENR